MKIIYLVRHSAPFVEIDNYEDFKSVSWNEYNRNMILSSEGEEKAKKLWYSVVSVPMGGMKK